MSYSSNLQSFVDSSSAAIELKQLRLWLRDGDAVVSGFTKPEDLDRALTGYLDFLRQQLLNNCDSADIGQVQEMLLEVSSAVRAGRAKDRQQEFGHFVDGLVDIYQQGYVKGQCKGFVDTVEDYADVIDSLTRELPSHDYDAALQQLVLYMNRMFSHQHKGWLELYGYLASMPENIRVVQLLRQNCFDEINDWVDGGVQNLFQVRADLYSVQTKLELREKLLEQEIARISASVKQSRNSSVVDLKQGSRLGAMDVLSNKLKKVKLDLDEKRYLIDLIDSNIREFHDLLAEARRSIFMRLVPEFKTCNSVDYTRPLSLEALIPAAKQQLEKTS